MIPAISIVGKNSNTGKTTVLCNIIQELKKRGYRVATIKHDVHGFDIDHPGKDTWKHGQAGSDIVMISSPQKFAMIEKVEKEYTLDEIISKIDNVDIIITEGYKRENKPKLEVFRTEAAECLLCEDHELFGLVTDVKFDKDVPQFGFTEVEKLVDHIVELFLSK
ncbi:molybdopterin-guanine dinucleotide biosynthesis protein B [Alkaliphilus oremlandii]|uniref:Molybdopterin-guanine dinucleotide biosynthesis protein B n=1 Tax=Alkaliphilus oremlandii (strain OhILAs) TaxID=350688 RepID=A8MGV6_ALKOO|nr:molybdopterin-guanine dinucleotide biosynthesis protein B [Alkaliphilus oremlandii]ABW18650.1 molybdopterin-guanine dinucleotide biosynthesis protein B [Alkaliphilus oremlandii OhILAs]